MILVTGATGTTGSEVLRQLLEAGEAVRVLVRNPDKAESLRGPGVEVFEGDLARPETLPLALEGVSRVFLLTSPAPEQAHVQSNLVKASRRAGVKHLVKLSALGADLEAPSMLARWHGETEAEIKASGLDWTMLQPNAFMQNMFMFLSSIASQGAIYAPMADGAVSLVDVRDIAAVAVKALTEPGHAGRSYVITGPEALSYSEVAERMSLVIGKHVRYVDIPLETARQGWLDAGIPNWFAEAMAEQYASWREGHAAAVSPVVAQLTGREPIAFERFLVDNASLLRGAGAPATV